MDQNAPPRGAGTRRRRADAERSIEAILDAALESIHSDGELNMTAIARGAGVSRVTLYAHFPTRTALLEGALQHALRQVAEILPEAPRDGVAAPEAMTQLLGSSWQVLARHRDLHTVAAAELSPAQMRTYHEPVLASVDALVLRGQAAGVFRRDLPREWLISSIYALLHLAAEELSAGRLAADQAGEVVTASIMSLLRPGEHG